MFPALGFVPTDPPGVSQPWWPLQLTGAQAQGSPLPLSWGRLWPLACAALNHKRGPSLLIFLVKKAEKGCLERPRGGYGTDTAQGMLVLGFLA